MILAERQSDWTVKEAGNLQTEKLIEVQLLQKYNYNIQWGVNCVMSPFMCF